jgi:hypothetical protein
MNMRTTATTSDHVQQRKAVEQPAETRRLLVLVMVVVVTGHRVAAIEPERRHGVRIPGNRRRGQPVDRRGIGPREERWLPRRVRGDRIDPEVVIERVVFIEDDDQVLDQRARHSIVAIFVTGVVNVPRTVARDRRSGQKHQDAQQEAHRPGGHGRTSQEMRRAVDDGDRGWQKSVSDR